MNKKCRFKKLKKAFVGILAGVMVFNYVPLTGYAANEEEIQNTEEPTEEIQDTEEPTEEIQDTEEPTEEIQDTEEPTEEIQDTEEPTEEIQNTEQPTTEEIQNTEQPTTEEIQNTEQPTEEIQNTEEPTEEIQNTEQPTEEIQEDAETAEDEEEIQTYAEEDMLQPYADSAMGEEVEIHPDLLPSDWQYGTIGTNGNMNTYGGSVTKKVGETGFYRRCPVQSLVGARCGHLLDEYSATYYCGITSSLTNNDIVGDISYNVGHWTTGDFAGAECLETAYKGMKPGKTNVAIEYYVNFMIPSYTRTCGIDGYRTRIPQDYTWHRYRDNFDVTVTADYVLNYNANGNNVTNMPSASRKNNQAVTSVNFTVSNTKPSRTGYTFLGWAETPNATAAKYTGGESITLNWVSGATVEKTLYAVWKNKAPEAPKKEDLYGIMRNFVNVHCVNTKANHPDKQYSTVSGQDEVAIGKVVYSESEKEYTCIITANGAAYAEFYGWDPDFGTGVKHVLAKNEEQYKNIVLRWDSTVSKWKAKTATPVTFNVTCCQHNNIDYTDNGDGTHDGTCSDCKQTIVDNEEHTYVDGYCEKCGAEEPKNEATYKVVSKNVNGEVIKSEDRIGKVGDTVEVADADKVIEGYTFDEANEGNVLSATVLEDGSTELILYFIKDAEEPTEANYKVVSKNVNGEVIKSEDRIGKVGDTVKVADADKVIEGYTFDEANEGNVLSATVAKDGTTELILYFIKNEEKPDPEDPNKPENPDNPDPEDPNKPVNPDPENPDKPDPEDPNKPVNPDPENPDKPDPEDPGNTETPEDEEQPNRRPINPEVVVIIPEKPERTEITNTEITGTVTVINQGSTETESTKSDDSTKADIPKTGEETNTAKPLAILVCALMLLAALIGKRRFFRS